MLVLKYKSHKPSFLWSSELSLEQCTVEDEVLNLAASNSRML